MRNAIIAALVLTIAGVGGFLILGPDDEVAEEVESFTSTQVAEHDSEDDCWTIIDNNVYDITSYVPRHPGGDEILRACGTDGSTLFNSRTTAEGETVGSGTPHSGSAENQLSSLQIGILSD